MYLSEKQKKFHIDLLKRHYYFDIELSSACNLNCTFCPREKLKRKNKIMPKEIMEKLPQWLPEDASIMFSGMGEPLLNKNIFDLIKKLRSPKRIIGITTNGHLLNENNINKLIESNIDFIQISINTLDRRQYYKISGGHKIDSLLDNITLLNKAMPNSTIQFSFIKFTNTHNEDIEKQKKFSEKHNAIYFQKKLHNRGGNLNINSNETFNTCYIFSQITFISNDGDILYCCHDLDGHSKIGNILTDSFNQILEKKINIIKENKWLPQCKYCNDIGRKEIIK